MKQAIVALSLLIFSAAASAAQGVGIDFDSMPVGTEWTEKSFFTGNRLARRYLGKKDDLHQLRVELIGKAGTRKYRVTYFFDVFGRVVRSESVEGRVTYYRPFDCRYVVGQCTHVYDYELRKKKNGKTRRRSFEAKFDNRLDGKTLRVTHLSKQGPKIYPYQLGKYNIRMFMEYKGALGRSGFEVLEVREP